MMNKENELHILLEKVKQKEIKSKRFIAWLSFIPTLFAITLLYITVNQIKSAKDKLEILRSEIKKSEERNDSLEIANQNLNKRYNKLNELFQVYDWKPEILAGFDSAVIEEAKKANKEILRILDSDEKLNYDIVIRYYIKKLDNDRVKMALRRIGYRDLLFDNDSWNSKTPSNMINFDKDVDLKNVKFIALALLREGVSLKKISFYPKNVLKHRIKANSIEISGDEKIIEKDPLNFNDILSLDSNGINY
jgi:hypothetical protein